MVTLSKQPVKAPRSPELYAGERAYLPDEKEESRGWLCNKAHQTKGPCGLSISTMVFIHLVSLFASLVSQIVAISLDESDAKYPLAPLLLTAVTFCFVMYGYVTRSVRGMFISAVFSILLLASSIVTLVYLYGENRGDEKNTAEKIVQIVLLWIALTSAFDCFSYGNLLKEKEKQEELKNIPMISIDRIQV